MRGRRSRRFLRPDLRKCRVDGGLKIRRGQRAWPIQRKDVTVETRKTRHHQRNTDETQSYAHGAMLSWIVYSASGCVVMNRAARSGSTSGARTSTPACSSCRRTVLLLSA